MSARPFSYSSYLQLPTLLDATRPVTSPDEPAGWAAERFFMICHQTSELWLSQVLVDLGEAARLAESGDWSGVQAALHRATAIVELLSSGLRQLRHLPVERFLAFRPALDGVSAAESEQFAAVLRGRRHHDVRRIGARLDPVPAGCGVALALEAYIGAVTAWRRLHVDAARRFIGDRPGTGGSSGVEHLLGRVTAHLEAVGDHLHLNGNDRAAAG
jgi:tryptophan 2,3-dioxygenase